MSALNSRLPTSTVPCRYWAASGTCFFGDQCNFAHNLTERGSSGKTAIPKKEKACRDLLLNGSCKNEKSGCEYNHDIVGVSRNTLNDTSLVNSLLQTTATSSSPWGSGGPSPSSSLPFLASASTLTPSVPVGSDPSFAAGMDTTVIGTISTRVPTAAALVSGIPGGGNTGDNVGGEDLSVSELNVSSQFGMEGENGLLQSVSFSMELKKACPDEMSDEGTSSKLPSSALGLSSPLSSVVSDGEHDNIVKKEGEGGEGREGGEGGEGRKGREGGEGEEEYSVKRGDKEDHGVLLEDSRGDLTANIENSHSSTSGVLFVSTSIATSQVQPFPSKTKSLPISAPAFVPAAQRLALGSSGGTSLITSGLSLPGVSANVVAAANAPPFVPKSKLISTVNSSLSTTSRTTNTFGSLSNRQSIQQTQTQNSSGKTSLGFGISPGSRTSGSLSGSSGTGSKGGSSGMAVGSRIQTGAVQTRSAGTAFSSPGKNLEGGTSTQGISLPDGEDLSLGMTSMSPPQSGDNLSPLYSQGGGAVGTSPILRPPDGISVMNSVGERGGRGGLVLGTSNTGFGRGRFGPNVRVGNGYLGAGGGIGSTRSGPNSSLVSGTQTQAQRAGLQKNQFGAELSQGTTVGTSVGKDGLSVQEMKGSNTGNNDVAYDASSKDLGDKSLRQKQAPSRHTHIIQTQMAHQKHMQAQFYPLQHHSGISTQVQGHQSSYPRLQTPQRQGTPPLQQTGTQLQQPHTQRSSSGNMLNMYRPASPGPSLATTPVVAATTHGGATYFFGPRQGIGPGNVQQLLGPSGNFGPGGRRDSTGRGGNFTATSGRMPLTSKFMADELRKELLHRNALVQAQLDPEQDMADLPETVHQYHTLYPLEDFGAQDEMARSTFGVRSIVFKGISLADGRAYAIRRIDHRQVIPTAELAAAASEAVERWAPLIGHPHVITLRESFVSREIEDSTALFFVHDYYPGAVTLEAAHLSQNSTAGVVHLTVSEEQLWSYLVQLAGALRAIHGAGLYCRAGGLDLSKVLLTSRGRLRIGGLGVLDVLNGDDSDDPRLLQREDLGGCGRLLLSLACGSVLNASLDFMSAHFSPDLVRITQALLASSPDNIEGGGLSSIRQLYAVLADRMFGEIEQVHMRNDGLLEELSKECDNGRLLRLMVKLAAINERPDDDLEPGWSETGDRYLLKLFRDFVFHQSSEDGRPTVDWGHIVESLNKLDAGVPEKVVLLSRDQRSMLIVSYRDLLRCLQTSYAQLTARSLGESARTQIPGGSRIGQRSIM